MRFRELRVEASEMISEHGVVPPGIHFRWTAHHVREMFSALLPRDYTLDGSSMIQITFGPRGAERQYWQIFGCSDYYVEDFDFVAYAKSSTSEQERIILSNVETALCDIAALVGTDDRIVRETAAAVVELGFRYSVEIKKLRKTLRPSRNSVRIFRRLSAELGETWTLDVVGRDGAVLVTSVMGESPNHLDRRDFYKRAELDGGDFVIRDRLEKETFRFDLTPFIESP